MVQCVASQGYGEDPYLSGEMTSQVVKGMQGEDPKYALINAACKHFAAFDGPENKGDAEISGADWLSTYMPMFQKCFEAGSLSTMCTYAQLNGDKGGNHGASYGCQNKLVLTDWLRGKMKFKGFVVSDQGAIHDPAMAIEAGCDVEDGFRQFSQLGNLTRSGVVKESTIDRALERAFYVRMVHGEFDPAHMVQYADPEKYGVDAFDEIFYNRVSLEAARQSITLLHNVDGFLPLKKQTQKKVAVFGCLVHSKHIGLGGEIYSDCPAAAIAGYNSAAGNTHPVLT